MSLIRDCKVQSLFSCISSLEAVHTNCNYLNQKIFSGATKAPRRKTVIALEKALGKKDMVVEVLSPSTAGKDSELKLKKYMKAGVEEYWIVDPDKSFTLFTQC